MDGSREWQQPQSERSTQKNDSLLPVLPSASARLVDESPLDDFAAIRECPKTNGWQQLNTFAAACGYVWTTEASQLPNAPEWGPCASVDITPASACKQMQRGRRIQIFHAGMNLQKKTQIGFVENCNPEQMVLADVDGPTRFALRRATNESATNCPMKLLAVDVGSWLAAFGEPESSGDAGASGYAVGGAFLGGPVGSAPDVLFAVTSEPFHVATSQGRILTDGWSADGKKSANARLTVWWNGQLVQDDVEVVTKTGISADEAPGDHPLLLQAHASDAVGDTRYRNMWILPAAHNPR